MIGTAIGSYRLSELLGDGGLGAVYKAVDMTSGREVAVRVFADEIGRDPMLVDRLRALVPALKRLQHPNLAAVYDLVMVGNHLGLFVEYAAGTTLDRVAARSGRMDNQVAVSCAVQALRGIEHAHGLGVYHHALRPSNLLITPQGSVKVLDVGIGHALGANRKTPENRLLSVLAYLAPEQIQNQPGDGRSDLYAIGVILYQLLTGRRPFEHPTEFAMRQAHLNEPPLPPRFVVNAVPEWIDQVVGRALAKQPAQRFQNATEMRAVLEAGLGLSTSGSAAVVRDAHAAADGGAAFGAAPPIPPSAAVPQPTLGMVPPPAMPGAIPVPVPTQPSAADATVAMSSPQPPTLGPVLADLASRGPQPGATTVPQEAPGPAMPIVPAESPRLEPDTVPLSGAGPASPAAVQPITIELPPPSPPPPPIVLPPPGAAPALPAAEARAAVPMAAPAPGAAKAKRSVGLVIALAVLAMALAAGGGYYWMTFGPGAVPAAEQPPADAAPPPADVAAAQPEVPPAAADTQPPPPDAATALPPPTGAPATAAKPAGTPGGTVGEAGRRSARPRSGSVTPIVPAEPPAPTIVAPPPPVETPPAAVAEPSSPPKRADNGAAKTTLPELSFRKVKIVTELDTGTREIEVNLMFQDDRLGVSPAGGGATFRTVRYRDVQSASYAKAQKKRLFIKSSKHLLTIETADQPLVLRLDKDNFEAIITALEARTSKTVER